MSEPRRVLVTGGSGRAGRLVVAELQSHGYEVRNFDTAAPSAAMCEFVQGDLTKLEDVERALAGMEAVCHVAGIPKDTGEAVKIFDVNVRGTFNVLEAAARLGVKKVVFASSIVVYGVRQGRPPRYLPIDEEHECAPATTYAMSKLIGEILCRGYSIRYGMSTVCLRLGNFTLRENIFSKDHDRKEMASSILGGKVAGEDVAQAFRLALESDVTHGVFIICSKHRYREDGSIDSGENVKVRAGEAGIARVDASVIEGRGSFASTKAERVLGYQPTI